MVNYPVRKTFKQQFPRSPDNRKKRIAICIDGRTVYYGSINCVYLFCPQYLNRQIWFIRSDDYSDLLVVHLNNN